MQIQYHYLNHTLADIRRPKRLRNLGDTEMVAFDYESVLRSHKFTHNIRESLRRLGIAKDHFYRGRHIAELRVIDRDVFDGLLRRAMANNSSLYEFDRICKFKMLDSTMKLKAEILKRNGKLLP